VIIVRRSGAAKTQDNAVFSVEIVNGEGHIASFSEGTSGMARFVDAFHFYSHTPAFIHEWNEPCLPLPSQPKLVLLIY